MMRAVFILIVCLVMLSIASISAEAQTGAQPPGRELYIKHCFWCHGEEGRGDGLGAVGMFPRPRDFVRADYRIRSTPHGQLPTDDDLYRVLAQGFPASPMTGWEGILTEKELRELVTYLKLFSPRFQSEKPVPLAEPPQKVGSAEAGKEIYRKAKCFMCHGESGRGDGGITVAMNFEWGLTHMARDLTKSWAFKGGSEPRDIYLRITGGVNGTPMGPYQDLLSKEERWDLAHYVASLVTERAETSYDFVVAATYVEGEIPEDPAAVEWEKSRPILVPLAGQVVLDPPSRWWTPTALSATVRALCNGREIGFLLEWNDPTGPDSPFADSAFLQFAVQQGSKPYLLFGDPDNPVRIWHWQTGNANEKQTAAGWGTIEAHTADFRTNSLWKEGRWRVTFRRTLTGEPNFEAGKFVPLLFSVRDGANGESGNVRAISTWLYATLESPPSTRPWLLALAAVLGTVVVEIWILRKLRS